MNSLEEFFAYLIEAHGGVPLRLMAIAPDDGRLAHATARKASDAAAWASRQGQTMGVYVHVNPVRADAAKGWKGKATLTDVESVAFLHVDIDPRDGEDRDAERSRILGLINGWRLRPTICVDSGNGYQCWYRLRPSEATKLDGSKARADELGRYNRRLAIDLTGDKTQDVSRILRVPRLTNFANDKKRAKGRVDAPTAVVAFNPDAIYDLSDFSPAAAPNSTSTRSRVAVDAPASAVAAVATRAGVDELQAWAKGAGRSFDDATLAYIATGEHPLEPNRHGGDRSAAVFAAACGLVRAGVPDALSVGVLTDSGNPISAHVLDQRGDKVAYAQRQLTRARELLQAELAVPSWDKVNKDGDPFATRHNTKVAMQRLGISCRQDTFTRSTLVECHELQHYVGKLTDDVEIAVEEAIHREFGFYPSDGHTPKAIQALALVNRFDSLIDHLNGLPSWDGTLRLDAWLLTFCAAEDSAYTRAAGAAWLTAAIVRAFEPGAKFDYMLVLQGAQGVGKSTAFRVLAGAEFFSDAAFLGAKGAREILEVSNGVWVLECAELDGMSRRDITEIKADISKQADSGRPAYARNPVTVPRRFVLAGTTNERRFLQDATGNRRFWPVSVGRIDLNGLRAARDQLLAEALARYRSGAYSLTLEGEAAAGAEAAQGLRLVVDEGYAERLENLSENVRKVRGQWIITNDDVYERLGIPPKDRNGVVPRKVKEAMRSLGWEPCAAPTRIDGVPQRHYVWAGEGEPHVMRSPF